jgi:hypothetical protein
VCVSSMSSSTTGSSSGGSTTGGATTGGTNPDACANWATGCDGGDCCHGLPCVGGPLSYAVCCLPGGAAGCGPGAGCCNNNCNDAGVCACVSANMWAAQCRVDSDCCPPLRCSGPLPTYGPPFSKCCISNGAACGPVNCCGYCADGGSCACISSGNTPAYNGGAAGCCSGVDQSPWPSFVDMAQGVCCQSTGQSCYFGADCCSGACDAGSCSCTASGGSCGADSSCCSGKCTATSNFSAACE